MHDRVQDDNTSYYQVTNDGDVILVTNDDQPPSPGSIDEEQEVAIMASAPMAEPVPILVSSVEDLSPSLQVLPPPENGAELVINKDPVTSVIGDFGKWQMKVMTLASIAAIFTAWSTLSISFLAPETGHWCAKPVEYSNLTDQQWKELAIPVVKSEKGSMVFDSCEMYMLDSLHLPSEERDRTRCTNWDFDQTDFGETITSKWELVCGRQWLISTGQSIFMAGKFMGCAVFGLFSDRFGRKATLMVCAGIKLFFGVIAAFAPNLWVFVSLHFLVAMSSSGMYTAGFVMVMEVIGGKWRSTFGLAFCYPFSIGYIMLSVMAWQLKDWWKLQLCICIPTVVFFPLYWILPESPRWLLSRNRYAEAEAILCEARRMNGMEQRNKGHEYQVSGQPSTVNYGVGQNGTRNPTPTKGIATVALTDGTNSQVFVVASPINPQQADQNGYTIHQDLQQLPETKTDPSCSVVGAVSSGSAQQKQGGPIALMRKGYMRRRMLNIFFCWFVNAFVYYGLSLNATNLGGNVFLNFALAGAIEIPAYTVSILFLLKFSGRRMLISMTMVTGGIACVLTLLVPINQFPNDWPVTALATVGKFGISASYAIIYVFTAELIPTIVRTAGVGISSTFARIGSIFAPFVLLLGNKQTGDFTYPMLICGALSITSGSLVWLLPETSTNPMPETFEQARQQTRKAQRLKKKQLREAAGNTG